MPTRGSQAAVRWPLLSDWEQKFGEEFIDGTTSLTVCEKPSLCTIASKSHLISTWFSPCSATTSRSARFPSVLQGHPWRTLPVLLKQVLEQLQETLDYANSKKYKHELPVNTPSPNTHRFLVLQISPLHSARKQSFLLVNFTCTCWSSAILLAINAVQSLKRSQVTHNSFFIIWPVRPRARFHCKTIEKIPVWGPYVMARAGPEKAVRPC